jgi:DNA invertase Pin-like site-specific DNA recombinase
MLARVRVGDEISHLARNTADLLARIKELTNRGVTITFKKEGLAFTDEQGNAMNQMLLTMLGAVASFEPALIHERRVDGQSKVRAAGTHMGRAAKLSTAQVATIGPRAADGASKIDLAQEFGVSRATLYAALKVACNSAAPISRRCRARVRLSASHTDPSDVKKPATLRRFFWGEKMRD